MQSPSVRMPCQNVSAWAGLRNENVAPPSVVGNVRPDSATDTTWWAPDVVDAWYSVVQWPFLCNVRADCATGDEPPDIETKDIYPDRGHVNRAVHKFPELPMTYRWPGQASKLRI